MPVPCKVRAFYFWIFLLACIDTFYGFTWEIWVFVRLINQWTQQAGGICTSVPHISMTGHAFLLFFFVSLKKPQLLSIQITAGLSVIIESDYHCSDLFVVLHKTNLSSNSNLVPVSQVLFLPSSQSWRTGLWTSPCHKTWAYLCTEWLLLQLLSSNYGVVFVISSSFCCIQMFFVVMTWLWMLMALMNWAVAPSSCCS